MIRFETSFSSLPQTYCTIRAVPHGEACAAVAGVWAAELGTTPAELDCLGCSQTYRTTAGPPDRR